MKNYLIKGLYKVNSTEWWTGHDRADEGDLYGYYSRMAQISENSCLHYLQGDWEYIKLESTATDINHALRQEFRAIWDIWSKESCNIYYVSSDSLIMQPFDIFGRRDYFSLFNYTDPKTADGFDHYLNADIRYYPAKMDRALFEQALADLDQAVAWGDVEKLYNRMAWSQGIAPEQMIDPLLAYQAKWIPGNQRIKNNSDEWNACPMENSFVVHWYGSQNAANRAKVMKTSSDILGIPENVENTRVTKIIDISHLP